MAADASARPLEFTQLRIGFDGAYKLGCWTPLELTLAGESWPDTAEVEVLTPDSDSVLTRVSSGPLPKFSRTTTVRLYVRYGLAEGELTARVVDQGQILAERTWRPGDDAGMPVPLPATTQLIVIAGKAWQLAEALPVVPDSLRIAQVADIDALPSHWHGYEGVDRFILLASDKDFLSSDARDSRFTALRDWVRLGGRVLVSAGAAGAEVLRAESAAWLAPGTFAELEEIRQFAPIEAFAAASQRIADAELIAPLAAVRLTNVRGRTEMFAEQPGLRIPLVVRAAEGFGELSFVAFDLTQPPIATWVERGLLYAKLLGLPSTRTSDEAGKHFRVHTLGYNDLAGQLRSALFEFEGVRFVSFFVVGGLIFAYLLLIGPIDFLLVRKWLKRPEWTWFTFPLTVVAVGAAAYFAAYSLKGTELRTNQAEIIDFDASTGLVRGTVWASMFSPAAVPYDLSLQPAIADAAQDDVPSGASAAIQLRLPQQLLSWFGLPGEALGGMDRRGTALRMDSGAPYEVDPIKGQLRRMPIHVWSTKSLTARWQATAPAGVAADLKEDLDRFLQGTITNRLGFDLVNARVYYDRWVYQLPRVPQGGSLRLGEDVSAVTSKTLLARQRIVASREVAAAFDTQTKDIDRILEIMMFHELAGGVDYTGGLVNRYQGFVDLSRQLELGRAILVVRAPGSGSQLLTDGSALAGNRQNRRLYYRIVLPVEPRGATGG